MFEEFEVIVVVAPCKVRSWPVAPIVNAPAGVMLVEEYATPFIDALLFTISAVPAPVRFRFVPVAFVNVAFASEEEVFTVSTVIEDVASVEVPVTVSEEMVEVVKVA